MRIMETNCSRELWSAGLPASKTCMQCGLGPCTRLERLPHHTRAQVDIFAYELKKKLLKSMDRKGKSGWENPDWKEECQRELIKHVAKGDPLDVAAYAMFCHYHGWSTWPDVLEKETSNS